MTTEPPRAPGTDGKAQGEASEVRPAYIGIGCLTAVAGFAGGGMIAVLIAKIVGALSRCAADTETGAPCNWGTYWLRGAIVGMVLLPTVAIWLARRSRKRAHNSERG